MSEPVARDPGSQQERTTLAWRRTGLALLVGVLGVGRLTLDTVGPAVVLPTVLLAALAAYVVADTVRHRRVGVAHPDEPEYSVMRDGRLVAAVSLVVVALGAGVLVVSVAAIV